MYFRKADRRSGASTGSSPRPATLSRELPDIPVNNRSLTLPADTRGVHSVLSENQHSRISSTAVDNHQRVTVHSTHLHTQLPEIPKSANVTRSPGTSPTVARQLVTGNGKQVALQTRPDSRNSSGMDDYDHIEETVKKKSRPRSDYDHVVLEGGEKIVKLAKDKLHENDYAEVKTDSIPPSQQEVTVISISKTSPTSQTSSKSPRSANSNPVHKVNSIDDPYNRIHEDSPYNKFKSDDPPYNKIKDDTIKVDDPYNTVKDDADPYNKVKGDIDILDDLDPYDAVIEGPSGQRSSSRKKTESFKGVLIDPYSFVDDERNVSNQTDPYARVVDMETEMYDPYNKVIEDNDPVVEDNILPEYGEDDYATVNKVGEVEYAKVNKQSTHNGSVAAGENRVIQSVQGSSRSEVSTSRENLHKDEYAKVVKRSSVVNTVPASANTKRQSGGENSGNYHQGATGAQGSESVTSRVGDTGAVRISVNNPVTPPEPPRSYVDEAGAAAGGAADADEGIDVDHYNTVSLVRENSTASDQSGKNKLP